MNRPVVYSIPLKKSANNSPYISSTHAQNVMDRASTTDAAAVDDTSDVLARCLLPKKDVTRLVNCSPNIDVRSSNPTDRIDVALIGFRTKHVFPSLRPSSICRTAASLQQITLKTKISYDDGGYPNARMHTTQTARH